MYMGLHEVNIPLNSLCQIQNGSDLYPIHAKRIFDDDLTGERA